ncbi:MAG: thiol:disulfide interchange protein, partial [Halobacteria archaeon]|nr:thiol:disulfide interchange protein [Halobacteria archaeon]
MIKIYKTLFTLLLLVFAWNSLQAEEELLEPDKAFPFQVIIKDDTIHAEWNTANGYYLYRNKIRLTTDTAGISLGELQLPAGEIKKDEFFGEVEIYHRPVSAQATILREDNNVTEFELTAVYQGCADIGVCYPPIKKQIRLDLPAKSGGAVAALSALGESLGFGGGGGGEDEILEPDQAFQFSMDVADPNTLVAYWQIAPDHYMYRGKINFDLPEGQNVQLGQVDLPAGEKKHDEFFGDIEIYHDQVKARLPLLRTSLEPTSLQLTATYQGCAEKTGICYPPIKKKLNFNLPIATSLVATAEAATPASQPEVISEQDQIAASA